MLFCNSLLNYKVCQKSLKSMSVLNDLEKLLAKYFGTIHLRRRHVLGGGGVKNLPNLPTDSTKKLPTLGG